MKDNIRELFRLAANSYIGGILFIILGLLAIWLAVKGPDMSKSSFREDIKGWAGGIMLIIIGIGIIIAKFVN